MDVVDALLKKGAQVDEKDASGKTPLDYANQYGHEKVAKLLKSSGAEGNIDPRYFGDSPYLKKILKEGEAYAWNMGRIGYAVKTKNHFLLFGYSVLGNLPDEPRLANGHVDLDEIADCDTMVFAGGPAYWHHNPERYNRWQKTHKNISFIYSFEDKLGRNPNYFKDVEGPEYIYVTDGQKKIVKGVKVETIPVSRGSGFLVEVDGLVIFWGGDHLMFDESQRESFRKVIDYVKAKYGQENVTQIITFGTMGAKGVVRDVGRALGLAFADVDRIARLVPDGLGMTLERARELSPELENLRQRGPVYERLLQTARALEGLARHASTHAAGVLITPGPLMDYVPLYRQRQRA